MQPTRRVSWPRGRAHWPRLSACRVHEPGQPRLGRAISLRRREELVRDAREHGVDIRSVDVNHSDWDCTLEGEGAFDPAAIAPRHRQMRTVIRSQKAVRLGFRLVKGLREKDMAELVARRQGGYRSVRDLWLRSGLSRSVLERLAESSDTTSVCLRFVDPYGDTVFNHSQARVLAAELRGRLSELGASEADSIAEVIGLAEQCADGVHLYLWCIGD